MGRCSSHSGREFVEAVFGRNCLINKESELQIGRDGRDYQQAGGAKEG